MEFINSHIRERKHRRFRPAPTSNAKVIFSFMDLEVDSAVLDISLGGFAIHVKDLPVIIEDQSELDFMFLVGNKHFTRNAKVVYSIMEPHLKNVIRYGLKFSTTSTDEIEKIIQKYC